MSIANLATMEGCMFQTVASKAPRFRQRGFKLENIFAGPVSTALLFNGYGVDHEEFMRNYTRMTCAEVAVRDENAGELAVDKKGRHRKYVQSHGIRLEFAAWIYRR